MAPQKRKRQSTRIASNKRQKYDPSSSGDEADFWKADCILAERRTRNKLEYKVQWEGTDPATGQNWAPTWEPASHVNEALLDDWLADKAAQQAGESAHTRHTPSSLPDSPAKSPAKPRPRGRSSRNARVITSSPEAESAPVASTTAPVIHGDTQSSASTTPAGIPGTPGTPKQQARTSPLVCVGPGLDSAKRIEYERYSQILPSQAVQSQFRPDSTQRLDLDSSQLFAAGHNVSTGIIPDSQSSAGEASYVTTTQASTSAHTTQHTQNSSEEFEEDSGLLEIIQAASRAVSPAYSIPETVAETQQESQSQSQRRQLQEQEQIEIAEASERVDILCPATQATTCQDQSQPEQSVAVQEGLAVSIPQGTPREEHPQEEIVQPDTLKEAVEPLVQETAAQQEAIEQVSEEVAQQKTLQQEGELQQTSKQICSQATTQSEHVEITQRAHSQPETAQQIATQQEAFHCENDQNTQPETFQNVALQQDTAQQQTAQFEDTPQPAQDINQATLVSDIQDTVRPSSPELEVTCLEQSVEEFAKPSVEFSVGSTYIARTTEGPQEAPGRLGDINESDTPAQVPDQATPHPQVRAQTPNIASPVKDDTSCNTERHNSTFTSQPLYCLEQSVASREQNAQLVVSSAHLSPQDDTAESIRLTIEVDHTSVQNSPDSRHDSSQETPQRHWQSVESSSSPIASPPSHSFGTLSQNVPPRPLTPHGSSSSYRAMTDTSATEKRIREQMDELAAKHLAENPFTPRFQRKPRSTLTPTPASETPASISPVAPRRMNAVPSVNVTLDGTRSPSTVPDRSPAPQAPTSLRTVALANSREQATGEAQKEPLRGVSAGTGPRAEHAEFVAAVAAAAAVNKPKVPSEEPMQIDDEESSDIDDDGSVLNDDLQLDSEEYIVPLFIEGRQNDMYLSYIKDNRELLDDFLKDSQNFEPIAKVEEVLSRMRAIETHMDLVYAEADSASRKDIESAARFGVENSAKFKFLHAFFLSLRDENKHIVLVTEQDNDALFSILETFCKANLFNFNMPTKRVRASSECSEGNLSITIFPSTASPITRAADLIICLDGVQSATKIRQKNWAIASGPVPILHLVLPRSIGHIERYMSSTLDSRERMNTIIASLAQMRPDIGKPIDEDTPRASTAAKEVANWIMVGEEDGAMTWPLPSIGSVKAVIEFQTQRSPMSSGSSVAERTKRPLDDEDLEQAKRMRFTPQPQVVASSYPNNEDDTTRVSNSVPGTAETELSWLRQQLQKERTARKEEEARFREHQVMWEKQQEQHENLVREHRLLLGKQKDTEEKLEKVTKSKETLQERLSTRTTENQVLETQLKEQQAVGLSSHDDMIVEMTRLKMDLAAAQEERQKAVKSLKGTEAVLDYIKEQYRMAQEAASQSQTSVSNLTKDNAQLSRQASGEVARLKQVHHDRQFAQLKRQKENQCAEIANLKRFLAQREEELVRAKSNTGRMGVGTRAQSATPAPKTRSRAASPMRVSNLRNG